MQIIFRQKIGLHTLILTPEKISAPKLQEQKAQFEGILTSVSSVCKNVCRVPLYKPIIVQKCLQTSHARPIQTRQPGNRLEGEFPKIIVSIWQKNFENKSFPLKTKCLLWQTCQKSTLQTIVTFKHLKFYLLAPCKLCQSQRIACVDTFFP